MRDTPPRPCAYDSRPCVLVTDDERDVRELIQEILEEAGCQVLTAGDGRQAIAYLAQRSVDLFIVDLVMPEQEGIETISAVRQRWPGLKVLAISGSGALYLRVARLMGAQGTLQKPFTVDALIDKVESMLHIPAEAGAAENLPFSR
jgi:DNA-binding response OmpR family regulator